MKKTLIVMALAMGLVAPASAQQAQKRSVEVAKEQPSGKGAEIKFATVTHDFGTFAEKDCPVTYEFEFTNVGTEPLIIHQAVTTCGCTVPNYSKDPIAPGGKGKIEVVYNGRGKFPGKFKKNITVRTNSKSSSVTRLFIEGDMTADK
ncbi:MAG: DUF1573 domain-containing protein [Bacteroidaceae bacterium]|nr:DUF1573 domain-containing protein [Bacteroidaceae bacterium]